MACCTVENALAPQMAQENSASINDWEIVALVWRHIESLLASGPEAAATVRMLNAVLPKVDSAPTQLLPGLAQLHLGSAGDLMASVKLMVPQAFKVHSGELDLESVLNLTGPAASIITATIELQLFHLNRAQAVTTLMRKRIAQKQAAEAAQAVPLCCRVTSSNGSGFSTLADEDLVQSLE